MTETLQLPETADTANRQPATRRPRRPLLGAALLIPVLALGSAAAASAHKSVELDIDGEVRQVSTWSGSVEGLLAAEGIDLAAHDEVAPGLDSALGEDSVVVVRHAELVEVMIDGEAVEVWTTADSAAEVLADLQASGRVGSILASSRASARGGLLDMPLTSGGVVTVHVDGGELVRDFERSVTVGGALKALEITLGETDEVRLAPGAAGAVVVSITRIVHGERTEVQAIAFPTQERPADSLYKGQTRLIQQGAKGERSVTFATVTVDGVETEATEVSSTVTAEPVTRIVEVGTKARPAASQATGSAPAGVWAALAQCESGGNPAAVSASGTYHGLYQFSVGTWQSVGGTGLPSQASAAEQTKRAQILQARSGWGQWPACARKLGLL